MSEANSSKFPEKLFYRVQHNHNTAICRECENKRLRRNILCQFSCKQLNCCGVIMLDFRLNSQCLQTLFCNA